MKQNTLSKLLLLSLLLTTSVAWADGTDVTATYITNPGFEMGNLNGWTRTGKVDGYNASGVYNDNAHESTWLYATWAAQVTTIDVYQVLNNVAAGKVTDGGKASENDVMNADVKGNSFSIWDDDWSY